MDEKSTSKRRADAESTRLPESGGTRHEIVDDELYVTPPPGLAHQRVVKRLLVAMHGFVDAHDLGEVFIGPYDVLFGEGDSVEPDVLFVREDRADVVTDHGIEGVPDLVVEVLSPSTAARDRGIKLERYRHHGVPEYWIVDPEERTLEVWERDQPAPVVLEVTDVFRWRPVPGGAELEIPLGELFGEG